MGGPYWKNILSRPQAVLMSLVISPLLLIFLKLLSLVEADTGSFSRKFNSPG